LGDIALMQYLEDRPNIKNVVLCLDNDEWGLAACIKFESKLTSSGYLVSKQISKSKDFNDDLISLVKSKQPVLSI
jgi:hypothetical protein